MSHFELIIEDGNTLHSSVEEAKDAAHKEQIDRWGLENIIEWYETDSGWEGFNDLGFYKIVQSGY
jgi:hypothetical protein